MWCNIKSASRCRRGKKKRREGRRRRGRNEKRRGGEEEEEEDLRRIQIQYSIQSDFDSRKISRDFPQFPDYRADCGDREGEGG